MAITSVWCCVLQAAVTRVTDLEGEIVCVICSELETAMNCRVKAIALQRGPLSQLFDSTTENTTPSPKSRCSIA